MISQGITLPGKTIPGIHTDFIFSYLVNTLGWLAGLVIICLGLAMINISQQVKDQFGRMNIVGLTTIFVVQFFCSILTSMGLTSIAPMDLPFISYGGSKTIINLATIGLTLSIYRRKNLVNSPT